MFAEKIAPRNVRGALLVCLLIPTGGSVAAAADSEAAAKPVDATANDVVVTASRIPESIDTTLWSTTVLTREDIEARQASSLQELLAQVAGIDVVNNGGLGKVSDVLMRGAEADHTLLMVDGVRVASATAGTAPFEFIPLSQIDHIEIVRGPHSTLYGTDAIGGVIQVFTRRAQQPGFSYGGSVNGGSHDTQDLTAEMQARGERAWISAAAGYFDTDGFNSCEAGAAAASAGCFTNEPDRDGYRNHSGSLAAGYQFNDNWKADARALLAKGRTEFDGSFSNSTDFFERVFALSLEGKLGSAWHTRVTLGRDVDNQTTFLNNLLPNAIDTRRDTAGLQFDGQLPAALRLVTGIDYQRDKVGGDTDYELKSRSSKAVFAELHGSLAGWSSLAGARYEDNQQFGGHFTANVGTGHQLDSRHRLVATWGTAFHAPSFNDLYYPGFGNPHLEPEKSRSFEIGVDGVEPLAVPLRWSLHVFQTDIDQLIGFDSVLFIPVNIDKARIRGAELQAGWSTKTWKIGGHYTQLDPVNRSDADLLPRRPKQNASLELRRLWPMVSLGMIARYEGGRFDDLANTRRLGGFFTLDLAAELKIGRELSVQGRVANLFDRDYHLAAFYPQDERNYSITLRYRFSGE